MLGDTTKNILMRAEKRIRKDKQFEANSDLDDGLGRARILYRLCVLMMW